MIRLEDTSGTAVAAAIAAERHRQGSPTTGMVLTLLILASEEHQEEATSAAVHAARQHPMRIITVIPRQSGHEERPKLDALVFVGGDEGPGEIAILRLRGSLAEHAGSVVIPLLLPDTPIVAFWPGDAPADPSRDPIGRHASRRITDIASGHGRPPLELLLERAETYSPGDTDLAWTRLTAWRTVLAGSLDALPEPEVTSVSIEAGPDLPTGRLLAAWLGLRLQCRVSIDEVDSRHIESVVLATADGPIEVRRTDADRGADHQRDYPAKRLPDRWQNATFARPGSPTTGIMLPIRGLDELLAEELRHLGPDDEYGDVLAAFLQSPSM
jgi:glucose-6-phosphate dehydrogenase assembly protein OpcA